MQVWDYTIDDSLTELISIAYTNKMYLFGSSGWPLGSFHRKHVTEDKWALSNHYYPLYINHMGARFPNYSASIWPLGLLWLFSPLFMAVLIVAICFFDLHV